MNDISEIVSKYGYLIKPLIVIIVILIIIGIVRSMTRKVRRKVVGLKMGIRELTSLGNTASAIMKAMDEAKDEPEVKSIGGNTQLYLSRVQKDFPNYHGDSAEFAIENFIKNYVNYIYGNSDNIGENVNKNLILKLDKKSKASISNLKINKLAIYNYVKTSDYATVTYRISVGFDVNGKREETRYEVEYTYELARFEDAIDGLVCPNCGGRYDSINDTKCPFCGALVVKDTYMNWLISSIKEI